MTLDNEKGVVLKCNVSACNQKIVTNLDPAWITVCGHIFCASCGLSELGSLPAICPVCSHNLSSPFDILKADINPPSHFIKMVLMGLNPEDCIEAARSGIQFWQTQNELQLKNSEIATYNAHQQLHEMQIQNEEKMAELNREIALLREECLRLKEELGRQSSTSAPRPHGCVNNNRTNSQTSNDKVAALSCVSSAFIRKTYPAPTMPHSQMRETRGPSKKQFLGKF